MRTLGAARFWMDGAPAVEPLRLRRVPLLIASLCFAGGDLLARQWHEPWQMLWSTVLLIGLSVFAIRRGLRSASVAVFALWVAVGCWCAQMQVPVPTQGELVRYADGLSRAVRGRVVRVRHIRASEADSSAPQQTNEPWRMEPGAWEQDPTPTLESVDLQVEQVEDVTPDVSTMRPIAGGVRVAIQSGQPELACGELIEVPLRMRVPEIYRDPGAWSYADELLRQGLSVQASAKATNITQVADPTPSWRCRVYAAQSWASVRLERVVASRTNRHMPSVLRLNEEDGAMLRAMLFGDRTMLTRPLRAGFERTGTFHLFVVSGLHVALVAGGLLWLLRRMRMPEIWATFVTIAVTTSYAVLTGFGAPVQRALAMSVAYLLAQLLSRERNALNALGGAALAILVLDPRALFESSFQMTAMVIVAIAGLGVPLEERLFARWRGAARELWSLRLDASLPPRTAQLRVRLRMWSSLLAEVLGQWVKSLPLLALRCAHTVLAAVLIGFVAEICMMLPMAVYFHRATWAALPVNAVCIPLVAVLLTAGIATFCVSLLSVTAAALPGAITALLLHIVRGFVAKAGSFAVADMRVPQPAVISLVIACVLIAFCLYGLRARGRAVLVAGLCAAGLVPVLVLWPAKPLLHLGSLEVTALDVGQGDSLLMVSPDGHTMLIDAGGPVGRAPISGASKSEWDVGEEVVAPYLWSRRVRRLDAVLLTHAHSDHMGGMPAILRDFRPRELWLSVQPGKAPGLQQLLAEAARVGTTVRWLRAGDSVQWGGLDAEVLSPTRDYTNAGAASNDDSLVVRVSYGKASVLLEGDAEAKSEAAMVASGKLQSVTLLKVGHHGSKTSTTPDFLAAVAPREAVVSVGRRNTFGHPRFEVLERLEAASVQTYRTDRAGVETFLLKPDGGIVATGAASN